MKHRAAKPIVKSGFEKLARHRAIGWDFDETLIDHPNSPNLHQFIKDNPHLRHVIVTFRTHGWQNRVFAELREYRGAPGKSAFGGVFNIPDDLWTKFEHITDRRRCDPHFARSAHTELEQEVIEWKAKMCKKLGLTVMVDDMTDRVMPGCLKHGIEYIHPDELW